MLHPAPEPTPLATRIRKARETAGLRAVDLAKACDVTSVTVWRWECRNQKPGAEELEKIAEHTKTTSRWLLKGDEVDVVRSLAEELAEPDTDVTTSPKGAAA